MIKHNINPATINAIKEYLQGDVEYCGNFIYDNELLLTNVLKGQNINNRRACVYTHYSTYLWHTHPNKYYPSNEDILKILKRSAISYSYIFTNYGYWVLYKEGTHKDISLKKLAEHINNCGRTFYIKTDGGLTYNPREISDYIRRLKQIGDGFNIKWITYKDNNTVRSRSRNRTNTVRSRSRNRTNTVRSRSRNRTNTVHNRSRNIK